MKERLSLSEERRLIEAMLAGDEGAVLRFWRIFKPRLLRFIERKAEPEAAEEILQETLIAALDCLPLYKGRSRLFTWLCGIARHEIADFYRKQKIKSLVFSRLPFLEKLVAEALGPELALEEKEAKERIWRTMKRLSEGYALILRLKYWEGLSMAQIAERLKITVKAVESRLFRARLAFQKEYVRQERGETVKGRVPFEEGG